MALFVIGDLHLSGGIHKPMDIFGEQWKDHHEKIKSNWLKVVGEDDLILIPGDISWAMGIEDAMVDLEWVDHLPGRKILLKGNHDYWWGSVTKMNTFFKNTRFLQNNYFPYKNYGVCGTRGWICPNNNKFTDQDKKIYERELHRLKLSLDEAIKKGYDELIVMTHYPPTNDQLDPSGFTKMYETYNVKKVVYGHLHGKDSFSCGLQGKHRGIEYHLTSCDYLDFKPLKISD